MKAEKIILASGSPRRRDLLSYRFSLQTYSPDIDESIMRSEPPRHYVKRMALEKWLSAQTDLRKRKDYLKRDLVMISADTIVVFKNKILGKPTSRNDAHAMLKFLSGKTHFVYSAFAAGRLHTTQKPIVKMVSSSVRFRKLGKHEIDFYLRSKEWRGKAGGYAIQGLGAILVDKIYGSLTSIVGLPVNESIQTLVQLAAQLPRKV